MSGSAAPGARGESWGTALRRRAVLIDIAIAVGWCVGGFHVLIDPVRRLELALSGEILSLLGQTSVSTVLGNAYLIFRPGATPILANLTPSCSALSSLLALSALAFLTMRQRPQAAFGLLAAAVWAVTANQVRLVLSLLAGVHFGVKSLVLFHDWVGAVLNFCFILIGLLIMVAFTMHRAERAEQDRSGRHTARRPLAWGRPGLGYRLELEDSLPTPRVRLVALIHRRFLPPKLSRRLGARRERGRIDYRLGHLRSGERAVAVRRLAEDGLGAHTATLLAVASYETDGDVLTALAQAVAARQWEPVSHRDITALRLWARAWLMRRPEGHDCRHPASDDTPERLVAVTGAGGPAGVAVIRALLAAGHQVLALDADPDAVGLRFGCEAAVLPRADDPGYAAGLRDVVTRLRPDALICTVAEEYGALIPLVDELTGLGCRTWLPDPAAAETCLDKAAFAAALRAAGVPHPPTATTRGEAGGLPGPWIVKPARGRGSRDVVAADTLEDLDHAFAVVPSPVAQTRLTGREFTADALVARDGSLLTCVPRWRDETKAGISVRGTTFDSSAVTRVVGATLAAVGMTGPANVQGFVADADALDADPDAEVTVTVVEVNPRFSGGLPLTLAAGADVVGTYLAGILDPAAALPWLTFVAGVRMVRHFAELYSGPGGTPVTDPLTGVRDRHPASPSPRPRPAPPGTAPGEEGSFSRSRTPAGPEPAVVPVVPRQRGSGVSRRLLVPFGTRPEVIKLAPVVRALRDAGHEVITVHTGQHTDAAMAGDVERVLGLAPDVRLVLPESAVRSGALIDGAALTLAEHTVDLVLALGDTATVPAYALAARARGIPFGHLEAGLRSFNQRSVEEVNRRVAAATAQVHFAPTARSAAFLQSEGVPTQRIFVVGNPVIDILRERGAAAVPPGERSGVLVTAHRPTNVDDPVRLGRLVTLVGRLAADVGPVVFPVHPRTDARLREHGLAQRLADLPGVTLCDPLPYPELLAVLAAARVAVTDSGGLQEEAAYFGVPVVVMRRSTPRWEGVELGSAVLSGLTSDEEAAGAADAARRLAGPQELARIAALPCPYGDGTAGRRVAHVLADPATTPLLQLDEPAFMDGALPWNRFGEIQGVIR